MDLNKNLLLPLECELKKNENVEDTTLCLNWTGFRESNSARHGCKQSNVGGNLPNASDDSCRLVLGLGPTPSTYSDEYYNFTTNRSKVLSPAPTQGLPSEDDSILQLDLSGGTKEVSTVIDYSVSSKMNFSAPYIPIQVSAKDTQLSIPVVDEGSTSAKISGGYMPSLLLAPKMDSAKFSLQTQGLLELGTKNHLNHELCDVREYSISTISDELTTGLSSERRTSNPKKCRFLGCTKGARGSSGLCIGHGGGQRCQKPGCNKGSETRTIYCKAHGGGKRCQHLGCTKSAEGKTDYCIAHGGGRRCGHPGGCNKASRGRSGLCIRHGGGKRCKVEGCTRSAEGQANLCISHGGGRRCQHEGCTKGAQGSTMYCKAHGGGKRCIFRGCTKGAEGSTSLCKGHGGGKRCLYDGGGICPKSVHGGTNFCVAHGGGKRCAVPGCTKSARGRTDCCVRHGGGKRCKYENCGKSAQGSTDFCKAHGGGKRCTWGEDKCEKFARGKSGLCAAHSSKALERGSNKGGLVGPGLFHALVSTSSTAGSSFDNNHSSIISVASDCIDSWENPAKRHQLIPPQVLVPQSMKSSSSFYSNFLSAEKEEGRNGYEKYVGSSGRTSLEFNIPEGRVHGGPLMSMFGGNLKNAIDGSF